MKNMLPFVLVINSMKHLTCHLKTEQRLKGVRDYQMIPAREGCCYHLH